MMMTDEEIAVNYRDAKDKRTQVRILAELNACSQDTIRAILKAAGQEVPQRAYRKRTEKQINADESRREKMREHVKEAKDEKNMEKQELVSKATEIMQEPEHTATMQYADIPDEVLEALTEKVIEITEQIEGLTRKVKVIRSYIEERKH